MYQPQPDYGRPAGVHNLGAFSVVELQELNNTEASS